ncbi:MAG: hypothetical protein OIN66_07385 [Candidatus Methanoperedens sp.]|nr:hypothetical protein [Candidatus Methanoperedens sp.]
MTLNSSAFTLHLVYIVKQLFIVVSAARIICFTPFLGLSPGFVTEDDGIYHGPSPTLHPHSPPGDPIASNIILSSDTAITPYLYTYPS